jgi:hypothetical protein
MKFKDWAMIIVAGLIAAVISFIIAKSIFKPPVGTTSVPQVSAIDSKLPDVKNDSQYNVIFNKDALDPTQPVQIGNQNNTVPFR